MTHSRLTLSLVDRFLTQSQQDNCSVFSKGDCVANTNCLLSNLDEYVKAGMSSGTQLLTLIPAALAILPSRGPNVLTAATFGYPFLLLSAFAGSIPAGAAAGEVARFVGHGTGSQGIGGVRNAWNERFTNHQGLRQPAYSLQARVLFLIMATILGCIPISLAVLFGPSMVVTWCCDQHYILLSWIIGRMSPALVEWTTLQATYWCVLTSVDDGGAEDLRQRLNLVRFGALLAQVIAKGAHGFAIIWGISVLGSTIMVDGLWAMMLLGVFPAAYSLMQLCLLGFTVSSNGESSKELKDDMS